MVPAHCGTADSLRCSVPRGAVKKQALGEPGAGEGVTFTVLSLPGGQAWIPSRLGMTGGRLGPTSAWSAIMSRTSFPLICRISSRLRNAAVLGVVSE